MYIQKSTAVSNLQNAPKVICINCKDDVPLTLWQDHQMICEGGSSKETGDGCEVCNGWNVTLNLLYEHVKWILLYLVSLRFIGEDSVLYIYHIFCTHIVFLSMLFFRS